MNAAVVVAWALAAGAIPWARTAVAGHRVRARLRAGHAGAPPARRRVPTMAIVVGAVGLLSTWFALGPVACAALVALAGAGPVQATVRRRARHRRARATQLPLALDRLGASLRSGASLPVALGEVGGALDAPIGPELSALGQEAARGRPVADVLDGWSAAHGDPGTRLAATAMVLAAVVGSAPARAVDGVAATVRERLDLAAERQALAAQARASALVLSVAPVGFAALLVLGDTAAADFLLGTPAGWACLVVGGGLDAIGAWWMTRLSRSDSL